MKLHLIRHAHTEWNEAGKAQGRLNIPLSETGHLQARSLGLSIKNRERISAVYASPLDRSVYTARYICNETGTELMTEDALTEIGFGEWEGLTFEEIGRNYPHEYLKWRTAPFDCEVPGAETLREVLDRCTRFLNVLANRHREDSIAIVSHTLPIKLTIAHIIGLPYNRIHVLGIDNTGRTELIVSPDGRNILVSMNDTSHLNGVEFKWQTLR